MTHPITLQRNGANHHGTFRFSSHRLVEHLGQSERRIWVRIPQSVVDASIRNLGFVLVNVGANAGEGLFYGVQTLVQLLRKSGASTYLLPEVRITDWPDLQLELWAILEDRR